jgi:predicted Rossmann fold nucleotide-binding protein DprA/Smf involved in DNA uptake
VLAGAEADVYALLRQGPRHIDDICRCLGHTSALISATVTVLEVKGHVRRLPGMVYAVKTAGAIRP